MNLNGDMGKIFLVKISIGRAGFHRRHQFDLLFMMDLALFME
jgi:hypothetical protein